MWKNHRDETWYYLFRIINFRIINRIHLLSSWWLWWSSMTIPSSHRIHVKTSAISTLKYLAIDLFVIVISPLDYLHPSHLVGLTISQESCGGIAEAPQQHCDCFSCRPSCFKSSAFPALLLVLLQDLVPGPGLGYVQFCDPITEAPHHFPLQDCNDWISLYKLLTTGEIYWLQVLTLHQGSANILARGPQ